MLFDSISSMWRHLRAPEASVSSQEQKRESWGWARCVGRVLANLRCAFQQESELMFNLRSESWLEDTLNWLEVKTDSCFCCTLTPTYNTVYKHSEHTYNTQAKLLGLDGSHFFLHTYHLNGAKI